jgi:hypothetical protein
MWTPIAVGVATTKPMAWRHDSATVDPLLAPNSDPTTLMVNTPVPAARKKKTLVAVKYAREPFASVVLFTLLKSMMQATDAGAANFNRTPAPLALCPRWIPDTRTESVARPVATMQLSGAAMAPAELCPTHNPVLFIRARICAQVWNCIDELN